MTVAAAAARVLQQVEQVERAARRPFGEEPLAAGRGDRRFGVAADALPGHQAIGADGDVRLDLDAELGTADAEIGRHQGAPGPRRDDQRQPADRAVREQRRHQHVRVAGLGVGQRQLPGEEGVGGTFGEAARDAAARVRAGQRIRRRWPAPSPSGSWAAPFGAAADSGSRPKAISQASGRVSPSLSAAAWASAGPCPRDVSSTTATMAKMSRRMQGSLTRYRHVLPGAALSR